MTGEATFGLDATVPGMLVALVARPPVFGGTVKQLAADRARAVRGVKQVLQVPSGVAVVADSFWAAKKGRDALEIDWESGPVDGVTADQVAASSLVVPLAVRRERTIDDASLDPHRGQVPREAQRTPTSRGAGLDIVGGECRIVEEPANGQALERRRDRLGRVPLAAEPAAPARCTAAPLPAAFCREALSLD